MTDHDRGQGWVAPGGTGDQMWSGGQMPPGWSPAPVPQSPLPPPGYGHPPAWAPAPGQFSPGQFAPGQFGPGQFGGWGNPLIAHKPGIVPLRPLGFGDILSAVFTSVRRDARTYFGLAFVTVITLALATAALVFGGFALLAGLETDETVDVVVISAGTFLLVVFNVAAVSVLNGILAYPVTQQAAGRRTTVGETWRNTRGRIPTLLGLIGLLTFGALLAFAPSVAVLVVAVDSESVAGIVVAIILLVVTSIGAAVLSVRWCLAMPAAVVERFGVIESLRRSWRLTHGLFWRTLGVLLVVNLIVSIATYVVQTAFQFLGLAFFGIGGALDGGSVVFVVVGAVVIVVGSFLSTFVGIPFQAVTVALLHLDARFRKDGFDMQVGIAAGEVAAGAHPDGWLPATPLQQPAQTGHR